MNCPTCKADIPESVSRETMETLRDALDWMYNPFEPENQAPLYLRLKATVDALEVGQ